MAGNPGLSGFDPIFNGTAGALVLTIKSGTCYAGGSSGIAITNDTNLTLTASTTTYVYFNPQTNVVTSNTTGFPPACQPIAIVTTGPATITSIQDVRTAWEVNTGAIFFSTAPQTVQTCNATVQNVATYALPAGFLNTPGKTIRFKAAGILNTSSASGLQVGLQLGGTNVCLINSANITTSLTNQPWQTEITLQTANTGVNGNIEGHGWLGAQLTAAGAAVTLTTTSDVQAAVSANIDLTQAKTLGFIALTNGAIVNFTSRWATLEILN